MLKKELLKSLRCEIRYNEPMLRHTSFKIGGKVDYLIYPKNSDDVRKIIRLTQKNKVPLLVIGGGTNLLVRDKGIRGVVISLTKGFQKIEILQITDESVFVFAGAGCKLSKLIKFCVENGFGYADCLAGIPGTIGGAIVMNAGSRDGEIKKIVNSVHLMDRTGKTRVITPKEAGFKYRRSNLPKDSVVLGADFIFRKVGKEAVKNRVEANLAERKRSQNISSPNAGSVFKNPEGMKAFKLIDEMNLRGEQIGGAQISKRHPNFIINKDNATAKDVIRLINLIKRRIKSKKGISLELEINIIGEMEKKR